jgi:hypothetical protein
VIGAGSDEEDEPMANSDVDTEDDRMVPPPAVAVNAARQQEAERGRSRFYREDAGVGSSIVGGVVAVILAVLSVVALWLTS